MLRYYKDIFSKNVHLDTDTTYKTQYTVEIVVCISVLGMIFFHEIRVDTSWN